jgi:hypothetical protein
MICFHISAINNIRKDWEEARDRGLPIDIDFEVITDRILLMKTDLDHLVFEEGIESENLIQSALDNNLRDLYPSGNGYAKLLGSVPGRIIDNACPG